MIYGVGFNSGIFGFKTKTVVGGISIFEPAYDKWRHMLKRCYYAGYESRVNYQTCIVENSWHDYQVFAKWFNSQPNWRHDWDIDKDILGCGLEYSEATCVLVPQDLNKFFLKFNPTNREVYICGFFDFKTGKWKPRARDNRGNRYRLGSYETKGEAFIAYCDFKSKVANEILTRYTGKIDERVEGILMNYKTLCETVKYD